MASVAVHRIAEWFLATSIQLALLPYSIDVWPDRSLYFILIAIATTAPLLFRRSWNITLIFATALWLIGPEVYLSASHSFGWFASRMGSHIFLGMVYWLPVALIYVLRKYVQPDWFVAIVVGLIPYLVFHIARDAELGIQFALLNVLPPIAIIATVGYWIRNRYLNRLLHAHRRAKRM